MTHYWIHVRRGFYFATRDDDNVVAPEPHVVRTTLEDATRQVGEEWVERKQDQLVRFGVDPDRSLDTFPADERNQQLARERLIPALAMRDRAQNARRLEQRGIADIEFPEDEDQPKKKRRRLELKLDEIPDRTDDLPVFKQPYQTHEEIVLRLNDTIVSVKSKSFVVSAIEPGVFAGMPDFTLHLKDVDGNTYAAPYSMPELNCRTPELGYGVLPDGVVAYLIRKPERTQQQGLGTHNSLRKRIGSNSWHTFRDKSDILYMLSSRKDRVITQSILDTCQEGLLHSVYLSKKVSLVNKRTGLYAEYKGRNIGRIRDHTVCISPDDKSMSHIIQDLRSVGLEV